MQLPSGPSYPGFPGGPLFPGYPAFPGGPSGPGMLYVPAKSRHNELYTNRVRRLPVASNFF